MESSRREIENEEQDELEIRNSCEVVGDDEEDGTEDEIASRIEIGEEDCEEEDENRLAIEVKVCDDNVVSDNDSGDDIWDEEKIPDPYSSDEDEDEDHQIERVEFDDEDELLSLGKTFNSPNDFKTAILRYSLKSRYDIRLYKSESWRIGARCSDVTCPWKCYCSYEKRIQKMQIKVFTNEHICLRSGHCTLLKRGPIAWLFEERLRKNPKITKQEMVAEIKREYNLIVSEEQCAKAKSKLGKERSASHEAHFERIWDYQAEVMQSNRHSTFEIETIQGPTIGSKQRFHRLFICFNSQKEAWKWTCRPIIGLDGAFLKWDIKGHLLAAVGRDGDNRIVPIAWGVVEIENDTNWDWFVRLLSLNLELGDGRTVAIISDKQKGLVKAVHNILPRAEHRQCARHIMDNWKKDSHDMELQRIFWKIARSYTQGEYAAHMEALRRYNPTAFNSLQSTNPPTWSRAFFRIGTCCNDNLNNLCESFNRTIRQARKKPLLDMLEDIRRQCMVRTEKRFIIAERLKTRFTKRAHDEIEKMIEGSQSCTILMARNNLYEVDMGGTSYCVDLNDLTCGCVKWQMTGIPCVHGASVIIKKNLKVEDYVSDYYTVNTWRQTYSDGIGPVQGMLLWPRLNRLGVLPPPWRKGNPGRPSNYARKKGRHESTSSSNNKLSCKLRIITCSNCKEEGHNKTSCRNVRHENQPKRTRGRPKKIQEPREILFGQGSQGTQGTQGSQALDSRSYL